MSTYWFFTVWFRSDLRINQKSIIRELMIPSSYYGRLWCIDKIKSFSHLLWAAKHGFLCCETYDVHKGVDVWPQSTFMNCIQSYLDFLWLHVWSAFTFAVIQPSAFITEAQITGWGYFSLCWLQANFKNGSASSFCRLCLPLWNVTQVLSASSKYSI